MSTTINDIAKQLNLSKSTVSKALNGYTDVAPATRELVTRTAIELGYKPSAAARSLSLGRTDRLGLFLNTSIEYVVDYLLGIIPGAVQQANSQGKHLLLYTAIDDDPGKLFQVFSMGEIDGVILFSQNYPSEVFEKLFEQNYPFVVMGKRFEDERVSYVVPDYYAGSYAATQHLIELGHTRIGFMTRPELGNTNEAHIKGHTDALTDAGLAIDPTLFVETKIEPSGGIQPTERLLTLPTPPTAIFAFHDLLALDAMNVIYQQGLRVPDDIAVVGFDGLRTSLLTSPHLTTVQQPLELIGQRAVEILNTLIDNPQGDPIQETVPVKLVIRGTTQSVNEPTK